MENKSHGFPASLFRLDITNLSPKLNVYRKVYTYSLYLFLYSAFNDSTTITYSCWKNLYVFLKLHNRLFFQSPTCRGGVDYRGKSKFYFYKTSTIWRLKVQSCKSYNNNYMIVSAQITNTEVFAFIFVNRNS